MGYDTDDLTLLATSLRQVLPSATAALGFDKTG